MFPKTLTAFLLVSGLAASAFADVSERPATKAEKDLLCKAASRMINHNRGDTFVSMHCRTSIQAVTIVSTGGQKIVMGDVPLVHNEEQYTLNCSVTFTGKALQRNLSAPVACLEE